jgi:sulfide:quinone oxidoreductase
MTEAAMTEIVHLTPTFAVSPQLSADDVTGIAALGFRAIVAVRPDGETSTDPRAGTVAALAEANGLAFRYAPATAHDLMEADTVSRFEAAVKGLEGPVLAYCKSGTRAAIVWALAAARYHPAACVGEALRKAGVDPDLIEDELKGQRRKTSRRPASLAVECAASVPA